MGHPFPIPQMQVLASILEFPELPPIATDAPLIHPSALPTSAPVGPGPANDNQGT